MSKEIIRLEKISKHYHVGSEIVKALQEIDLSINKNEFVAMMGPSGSGKSTLMNMLGCLDTPTSGHYHLNGMDVSKMSDNELAEVRNKEMPAFQNTKGFAAQKKHWPACNWPTA